MSDTHFKELNSPDPHVRAIARRVVRILNDPTLNRQQREHLVRKAQRDLVAHQKEQQSRLALGLQAAAQKLPQGYQARCITVKNGEVFVGAGRRKHGFIWIEAGKAPQGVACNDATFGAPQPPKAAGRRR